MSFTVEPGNLESFARLMGRAGEDFTEAAGYLSKNSAIDFSCAEYIWNEVMNDHKGHVENAKDLLRGLSSRVEASATELKRSAKYYVETDRASAAQQDAAYPESVKSPPGPQDAWSSGSIKEVCDASSRLQAVGGDSGWLQGHADEMEFAPINKGLGTLLDFTSPSALVNEGLKLAFDVDIIGTATNWLAGDWGAYTDCADAWTNLGEFCGDTARNIRSGCSALGGSWQGNAADSAITYFNSLADRLERAKGAFDSLAQHYQNVAKAVMGFAEFVKGSLVTICDIALQCAITAAAAGALSATGVGLLAGAAGAAVIAARVSHMMNLWKGVIGAYEALGHALNGSLLVGGAVMSSTALEVKNFPSPGKPYDNQLV
jgi:hypothetical protein